MENNLELQLIQEKAIELFNTGFNCSQSVLSAYSDKLNLDNNVALGLACGFGGGMGRLQSTCGAVTGAYMVFGMHCSNIYVENAERKEKSYLYIQNFTRKFVEKHKTTDCKLLLNCDFKTEEGKSKFHNENLSKKVCEVCIKDSIQLINELIESKK